MKAAGKKGRRKKEKRKERGQFSFLALTLPSSSHYISLHMVMKPHNLPCCQHSLKQGRSPCDYYPCICMSLVGETTGFPWKDLMKSLLNLLITQQHEGVAACHRTLSVGSVLQEPHGHSPSQGSPNALKLQPVLGHVAGCLLCPGSSLHLHPANTCPQWTNENEALAQRFFVARETPGFSP